MKKLSLALLLSVSVVSGVCAKEANDSANFEAAKAKMSENATKRMAIIEEFKKCVDSSTDSAALRECVKKERAAMRELRPAKRLKKQEGNANSTDASMGTSKGGV